MLHGQGIVAFAHQHMRAGLRILAVAILAVVIPTQLMPAPLPEGVEIENMTWVDVHNAIAAGYTTVIVPTGGLEQNGPHMIIGKHDYIVRRAASEIAKDVGHILVAPVLAFVPEGNYDPPTGHMQFPGTIGLPEPVFANVLEGIARSLKASGFKTICFIGDHGQSQPAQADVAKKLSAEWVKDGVRVAQIDGYYDDRAQIARLMKQGLTSAQIGQHASIIDTSEMMSVNPDGVDLSRYRSMTFGMGQNGATADPRAANAKLGGELLALRVAAAVAQIKSLLATE
ncbi:MAG: creatininase family protein [Hyphomicrobium sp.]|uniref:creatininase family protein n=1 Tax=Hyphomicrobium sp. TaxID=82 RepID=UPI0039E47C0D